MSRSSVRENFGNTSSWDLDDDPSDRPPPKTQQNSNLVSKALSTTGYTGSTNFPYVKRGDKTKSDKTKSFPGGSRRRLLSGKRRATRGGKKAKVNHTKKHTRQKKRRTNTRRKRS